MFYLVFWIAVAGSTVTPGTELNVTTTSIQSTTVSEGSLRLSGRANIRCSGRVEIFHLGTWGSVCDDSWDQQEAAVVCRSLRCGQAVRPVSSAAFGIGRGPIWLTDLGCRGEEGTLAECLHGGWGQVNCSHKEDAGVVCADADQDQLHKVFNKCTGKYYRDEGDDPCAEFGAVKLTNGTNRCKGLLELEYQGRWGTVCDDEWDLNETKVACGQLGCGPAIRSGGEMEGDTKRPYHAGLDTSPILLSRLDCRGDETELRGCRSDGWLVHDCHHKEDVWIECGDPVPVKVYNVLQDDFAALIVCVALTILLILVSTLLVYQLRHKDPPLYDSAGGWKLGQGEYGIYEDIDYAGVKRLSQISHVSEAHSSLMGAESYADIDAGSITGNLDSPKDGYDDVEGNNFEMEEGIEGVKEEYDDIEATTECEVNSGVNTKLETTAGIEYYDDVGVLPGTEGINSKLETTAGIEYYDDVDVLDPGTGGLNSKLDLEAGNEYYDDVDDINSVKEGDRETRGSEGKGDYENVPDCSAAQVGRGGPLSGDRETRGSEGKGDYENVPDCSAAQVGRGGPLSGASSLSGTFQKPSASYENVSVCGSVNAGDRETRGSEGKGDYENVPDCSAAQVGRGGPLSGASSLSGTFQKPSASYENVSVCGSVNAGGDPQPKGMAYAGSYTRVSGGASD